MKRLFIAIALACALTAPTRMDAQKHRHNPNLVQATTTADTAGVEAYSDTTSFDSSRTAAASGNDSWDDDENYNVSTPWDDIKDMVGIGIGGTVLGTIAIIVFVVIILAPFFIIGLIIYLIAKNRNQKYKLAEKAMESGQQIPEQLLRTEQQSDEYLWRKGIKNIFLGIGLTIFFSYMHMGEFSGIGWLVCFYGIGQAVISKTSASKRERRERREREMDREQTDNNNELMK